MRSFQSSKVQQQSWKTVDPSALSLQIKLFPCVLIAFINPASYSHGTSLGISPLATKLLETSAQIILCCKNRSLCALQSFGRYRLRWTQSLSVRALLLKGQSPAANRRSSYQWISQRQLKPSPGSSKWSGLRDWEPSRTWISVFSSFPSSFFAQGRKWVLSFDTKKAGKSKECIFYLWRSSFDSTLLQSLLMSN